MHVSSKERIFWQKKEISGKRTVRPEKERKFVRKNESLGKRKKFLTRERRGRQKKAAVTFRLRNIFARRVRTPALQNSD